MHEETEGFFKSELESLKQQNLYRQLKVLQSEQKPVVKIQGKKLISLCSNNYLGLTTHPKLVKASLNATKKYGAGAGSVRTIAGTMSIHQQLEEKLAKFKQVEATLVFQSGFAANSGVIPITVGEKDVIISDELNHASIIDGCRLTKAERKVYAHKNMNALEDVLNSANGYRRKLIITDGVFSMDGDIAPLKDIVELAEKYNAAVMVDDAHASGVLGKNGRGTIDHFGVHGRVDIQVGTLSKAIGAMGGYVAGSYALRDILIHKARPFLFSTSHTPATAAACIAAIEVLKKEPQLIKRLWDNTKYFKAKLNSLGFNTGASETPITPVIVGEAGLAMKMSDMLFAEGVFAQGIGFPTVAKDKARIRTIITATHTKKDMDFCLTAFEKVGKKLGVI